MMSVPVVKQPLPTSGGGATGPVGGGPVGAGPPTSQTPGKMVQSVPQPGSNTLPKNPNPGNQLGVPLGGHGVPQPGGMSQNLPNSNLMKMPPTASGMPMSMVANHTAAQSMVPLSLSGVSGAGTIAPLSLVQDHRPQSSNMQQLTPPAAHAHPTPPPPSSQRSPAPPAHSTPPPTTHPPQSIPPSSANPLLGSDKAKELVAGGKPTANGVQVQKAGESSGGSQQQMRKTPDGPVSLVINHSAPESMGTSTSSMVSSQQNQQTHSMPTSGGLQTSPAKPESSVANHASNQPGKVGLSSAPVANKVSPSPSPVKDKVPPPTPPKAPSATPVPKAPPTTANNETLGKCVTTPQSAPAANTQGTPVKSSASPSAPSPTKPAPATPAATTSDLGVTAGAPEGVSASPKNSSTTPPEDTKAAVVAADATESENVDSKTPATQEGETAVAPAATPSTPEKEAKTNTPSSTTPSRGSKRKRADTKSTAPTLGSSQAAAIAAASRTPNSKNKSQSDSAPTIGDSKKNEKGEEEDDEEEGRKPKRVRIRTQPYQSPLPEMAYLPKFTRTPTPKAQEDRLILFYKNEFLAVRNAEGSFYVCQTMQNIYKHSSRIRIRWLSQETAPTNEEETNTDGEVYSPDFYDSTDFDCILTNLNLDRLERGKYRLPTVELERTQSILKRALDAEKGVGQKTPLTEEHPDGLDLSLYRDESQLKKRRNSRRKSSQAKAKTAEEKNSEEGKGENKDPSESSSSSEEEEQNAEEDGKKPKREKRTPPAKESATPSATTPRARREAGKRKADSEVKAKTTPAKKRNSSSVRKRRSETPAAAPATPRAAPARATRSPKSAPAPSRKERSRVKENRKKPGKKA